MRDIPDQRPALGAGGRRKITDWELVLLLLREYLTVPDDEDDGEEDEEGGRFKDNESGIFIES